jgi:hypothetical protein
MGSAFTQKSEYAKHLVFTVCPAKMPKKGNAGAVLADGALPRKYRCDILKKQWRTIWTYKKKKP